VVRWRRIDLCAELEREFGVKLAERTMGTLLRKLGFSRLSVRPYHPQKDAGAQATFKKTSPRWRPTRCPPQSAEHR
jgi:transposase